MRLRIALKPGETTGPETAPDPQPFKERFVEAMDDDLNTPRALAALFDLAKEINRGREEGRNVAHAQEALRKLAGVLGLRLRESEPKAREDIAHLVELLVEIRSDLRSARRYDLADKIRQRLDDLGVTLEDTPRGTEWQATHG